MRAVAMLIAARARRWPARWLLPALGIALAVAYAGAVRVEATVAGTRAARTVLERLTPLDRVVRINWQGDVTPAVQAQATQTLRAAGLAQPTQVLLFNPVQLSGEVVRPAAITPLGAWAAPANVGPCRPAACPMRLLDARLRHSTLSTFGVRIPVVGSARLGSAAALGYVPAPSDGQPPVLLSGDVPGLDHLAGLSGIYRSHSWFSLLSTDRLDAWSLPALSVRLQGAQARLLAASPQYSFTAPFAALAAARAQADLVPRRLLLVGGGALAAILMFLVLATGGVRAALEEDLARLELLGGRARERVGLAAAQAALLSLPAVLAGSALALGSGALLADAADVPVAGALTHSLLTPVGGLLTAGSWVAATMLLTILLLAPVRAGIANGLALLAAATLIVTLLGHQGDDPALTLILAPLCCLAAGIILFRLAGGLLSLGERLLRNGPVLARLALVGLARGRSAAALAIAFLAVCTGLGGFALVYRSTLRESTTDQAAQQVPVDVIVTPTAAFNRPLAVASLARWRALSGGNVLPVRRTDATFLRAGASVAVPALGIPAAGLPQLHGWRSGDLPLGPRTLAGRLAPNGRLRAHGPALPAAARVLSLRVRSPQLDLTVTADLRDEAGNTVPVSLGVAGPRTTRLAGHVPPGAWELEALELSEPTGLQLTNDHQNGEGAAAATQRTVPVTIGPVRAIGADGRRLLQTALPGWRGIGAASGEPSGASRGAGLRFAESGLTGIVRPQQPSDVRRLPVLTDTATAAAAAHGRLAISVDGLPVAAQIVAVLRRFPTIPAGSAGFVVADEAALGSALDAQRPGQGRPDELWISTADTRPLRAALRSATLRPLGARFRADIQRELVGSPIARAVLGTLTGAAGLGAALALIGLLVVLTGALRDVRIETDLLGQGFGPRALRRELRLRAVAAAALGVSGGLIVALVLVGVAVRAVQAAGAVAVPDPPIIAVVPVGLLALWSAGLVLGLLSLAWAGTLRAGGQPG